MHKFLIVLPLALTLACASAPAHTPEQLFHSVCGTYTIVAMNAAELAQTGALSPEDILVLRVWDGQAYEACKAGVAIIAVGGNPSDATALAEKALAAFERYLIEKAGKAGDHPVPAPEL